jgi:hypothetical protein
MSYVLLWLTCCIFTGKKIPNVGIHLPIIRNRPSGKSPHLYPFCSTPMLPKSMGCSGHGGAEQYCRSTFYANSKTVASHSIEKNTHVCSWVTLSTLGIEALEA